MRNAIRYMNFIRQIQATYEECCKPLCQQEGLPQTCFDILMFLYNNPDCRTAREITEKRGIKSNLLSFHIEKLVSGGYLNRQPSKEDRRKVYLALTDQAMPVVKQGYAVQQSYYAQLTLDMTPEMIAAAEDVMKALESNLKRIIG